MPAVALHVAETTTPAETDGVTTIFHLVVGGKTAEASFGAGLE